MVLATWTYYLSSKNFKEMRHFETRKEIMHVLHYNNRNVHICIYTDWVSYVLLYLLYNKKVGWTLSNQKCFILCWSLNRIFGTSQAYLSRPCRSATDKNTQKIMISAWIGTNSYRRLECRLYVTKAGDVRTNIIAMFIWSVVLVNMYKSAKPSFIWSCHSVLWCPFKHRYRNHSCRYC